MNFQNCFESHQVSNQSSVVGQEGLAVVSGQVPDQAQSEQVQLDDCAEVSGVDKILKLGIFLQSGH